MLLGNPYPFAIWFDPVKPWSDESFSNGCFAYFIDGKLLWSLKSTLGVDLNQLTFLHCLNNAVEDDKLFNLPPIEAYVELCERAFPSMDSNAEYSDYRHLVSITSLIDEGHFVFLIESENQAKLIFGFKDDYSSVGEVILPRGEFQSVVANVLASTSKASPAPAI